MEIHVILFSFLNTLNSGQTLLSAISTVCNLQWQYVSSNFQEHFTLVIDVEELLN